MANRLEIGNILSSGEPDHVKIGKILEALYHLLKAHYHRHEETPQLNQEREQETQPNQFDFTLLSKHVDKTRAKFIVSELKKIFVWGVDNILTHKGKAIEGSNVVDLVSYLARRTAFIKKPVWYKKVARLLRKLNTPIEKRLTWSDYGAV